MAVVISANFRELPQSVCGQGNTSYITELGDSLRSSEVAFYAKKATLLQ